MYSLKISTSEKVQNKDKTRDQSDLAKAAPNDPRAVKPRNRRHDHRCSLIAMKHCLHTVNRCLEITFHEQSFA